MRNDTLLAVSATLVDGPVSGAGGALVGTLLGGRYEVFDFVGAGGMGEVYRARDRELDEVVAVKILRAELAEQPELVDRFRREVKLARRVTHRSVARTFELQEAAGLRFLTMEYVDGEPLSRLLARRGPLPVETCAALGADVAGALDAAHAAGVVHRDIKPDNVLVTRDGRAVVTDFGVAFAMDDAAIEASGTPAYMAPEQVKSEPVGPLADLYALGVTLFELATGELPFAGETPLAVMFARTSRPPPDLRERLPSLPAAYAEVVRRAMATRPDDRFASALELAQALEPLIRPSPRSSRPPSALDVRPRSLAPEAWTTVEVRPLERVSEPAVHVVEALQDELMLQLSYLPRVRVSAVKTGDADVVVSGSVASGGARVLLQATRMEEGEVLFSGRFPLTGASFALVADALGRCLSLSLGSVGSPPGFDDGAPLEAGVADLCLRARHHYRTPFAGDLGKSVQLYEEALARAPSHPRVLAGHAMALIRHAFFSPAAPEDLGAARQAVARACEVAPHRPEPRLAAGHLALHSEDPLAAARHFRDAVGLAPALAEGHEWLGRMLLEAGYVDEGTARLETAMRLDPGLVALRWEIARARALDGSWEDVERLVAELGAAGRRGGGRWLGTLRLAAWRGDAAWLAGLVDGLARAPASDVFDPPVCQAVVRATHGKDWSGARGVLAERALRQPFASRRRVVFYCQLATDFASANGDLDLAFEALERAVEQGLFDLHWLERGPLLSAARADPRYARLHAIVADRAHGVLDSLYRS